MFPKPSARDRIRTDDTRFRRAVLYPLSYWGNSVYIVHASERSQCRVVSFRLPNERNRGLAVVLRA